jgi:hypothetical protein
MERSYNGWPARPDLKTRVITPVKGVSLRVKDNDNVASVFEYLVINYHRRVDDLTKPHPHDDWGFAYRPNVNKPNELSNHSSATAVDLDATEHPNNVATAKTFTSAQIKEIHQILRELEGVLRWGGDYNHIVDGMHFEVCVYPGDLQEIGAKIRKLKKKPGKNGFRLPTAAWKPAK